MRKLILAFTALLLCFSAMAQDKDGTVIRVGQEVPSFSVKTLKGDTFDIEKMRGKVVLINFFATWCGPCMKELPVVQPRVWEKFSGRDFAMISIGREHTQQQLKAFNEKKGFTFPIAPDPKREVYSKFATKFIPRNIIVDKKGEIIFEGKGFSEKELEKMIKLIEANL